MDNLLSVPDEPMVPEKVVPGKTRFEFQLPDRVNFFDTRQWNQRKGQVPVLKLCQVSKSIKVYYIHF